MFGTLSLSSCKICDPADRPIVPCCEPDWNPLPADELLESAGAAEVRLARGPCASIAELAALCASFVSAAIFAPENETLRVGPSISVELAMLPVLELTTGTLLDLEDRGKSDEEPAPTSLSTRRLPLEGFPFTGICDGGTAFSSSKASRSAALIST